MTSHDELQYVVVHGYRRAYRRLGSGPVLLLLHGLACDSTTWDDVIAPLAENFTVIAPDLLGHGASDKPDADYSLGAYANGMRDLLTILGIDTVTVVGHSFGGGVAMQFAYQFPERTERIVLISTGGLGRDVTRVIRLLTLPGSGAAMSLATWRPWRPAVSAGLRALSRTSIPAARDLDEVSHIYTAFADPAYRRAVQRVTRHVLNWRGQFVTMTDRTYLARVLPVLVIWGADDMVIPATHAEAARKQAWSDVHVLADSGHFPHKDHPEQVVRLVEDFVAAHEPVRYHRGRWRAMLRRGDQVTLGTASLGSASTVDVAG
jgi:pimeloyl-ACP methyl ester carboxylesterase